MNFRKLNLLSGWLSFAIALAVYLLTLEPTVSFWDCGEFIASSYKLQVGHPPGAPLFQIMGRFFSLFAPSPEYVALSINAMSALASALTIMFLFWTISHLLKKIMMEKEDGYGTAEVIVILGGSFVGAMAYTFSDTFWFSAVEAEVYATSSLFTALVFWAILKWENVADEPRSNRWLILIAYLIGLSIGVHLLNLLAIPAIVLVFYFRKYTVTRKGVIYAILISAGILLLIMYGIINGIVWFAATFDRFFTNSLGLPFNTGVVIYAALLLGALVYGIYRTQFIRPNVVWNTLFVSISVILIGYSSYAMIVIRSQASPPMNENRPESVYSLLSYLNREQYGEHPLVRGHLYDTEMEDVLYEKPVYTLNKEKNIYEVAYRKPEVIMKDSKVLFPRMYSRDADHRQAYTEFGTIRDPNNPTYLDNLEFFIKYQLGHMYFRYFMWNFAGRQNDIQGHGGILNGNWISGIPLFDSPRLGSQKDLPGEIKNHPARNRYYFLPFLLGLVGLFFHLERKKRDFWVVMFLFILTGVAIVIYLNQTPYQPRERDYAYAGSFYAFSIWIGMGIAGIFRILRSRLKPKISSIMAVTLAFISAPLLMAMQNWDDHDRSGRYTARDIARNYLNSCDRNAILYTVGDNDTFPLWYAQDVEGIREDVRIVNMMLFNMDWYVDQMRWQNYDSEPLPFTLPQSEYKLGTNNSVYVRENERWANLDYIMTFIKSDDPRTKLTLRNGEKVDFIPTDKLIIPVDSAQVLATRTLRPGDADRMVDEIRIQLPPNDQIMKGELAQMDVFNANRWERPIYYTSAGTDGAMDLENYFRIEGLAYRVVPIETSYQSILAIGSIDTDTLYERLMNTFTWGRMNAEDVYLDYYTIRTFSVIRFRSLHTRLAVQLLQEGKREKAVEVLDRCMELAPSDVLPFDQYVTGITLPDRQGGTIHYEGIIEAYYMCGELEKGNQILVEYYTILADRYHYYNTMKPRLKANIQREINETLYQIEEMQILVEMYGQQDIMLELGIISPEELTFPG